MPRTVLKLMVGCTLLVGGCATQPDPYEVCSAPWIESRVDAAIKDFKRDIRSPLATLRRAGNDLKDDGEIGAFTMLRVTNALSSFVNKLEDSEALEDLQLLGKSCDDPDVMERAVTDLLRREGAPDSVINLLTSMRAFTDLQRQTPDDSVLAQ